MKYFTKEWYGLSQKIYLHLLLEEDIQAETFSEEYLEQLYKRKLKDWIDEQQQIASYSVNSQEVAGNSIESNTFDREKSIKQFHDRYIYNQENIRKSLPEGILNKIADIRVFALDKAASNVIEAVTQFCRQNEKSVYLTIDRYNNYYKKAMKSFDKNIAQNIGFHDCMVVKSNERGKSLILHIDNKGSFTDIAEIIFENYNILKLDGLLENSWWLYEELYRVNDKYELHVLLQDKNMNLIDFIISADHIDFKN